MNTMPGLSTVRGQIRGQKGAITLAVSLAILTLSTLVVFGVSRAILMEQRITNNQNRSTLAFEIAEAGMMQAMEILGEDRTIDLTAIFDTNADGVGDTNSIALGTGTVTVTATDLTGDLTRVGILSRGFSDDGSANRTISQTLETLEPVPTFPGSPVTSKGGVVISGSATVHNPEGHSTIWSGANIDLGSNNSTSTEVPDATAVPSYPGCMDTPMTCSLVQASSRLLTGVDIIESDSSLGNLTDAEFFEFVFGITPNEFRNSMVTIETVPAMANTVANLSTFDVIWIEGSHTFSGITAGCEVAVTGSNVCPAANTKPSIIIVNGNATFTGGPHFYGILYVVGNVVVGGNTTVHGAIVINGTTTSTTGGSLDVWYNSNILNRTTLAGPTTGSVGTWKDF